MFVSADKTLSTIPATACAKLMKSLRPLSEADFGDFLSFRGYIRNDQDVVTGCLFKGYGEPTIHEVYPGKVYSILSSTTAVDDDGCPEEVSIWHYVEIISCSE